MTRNEFIDNITEWYELKDFCSDFDCDVCEDIYDDEAFISSAPDCVATVDIDLTEMMGAETYLYFKIEDINFTARVNPRTTTAVGQTVKIAMDANKIHLFDKDTEKCIIH